MLEKITNLKEMMKDEDIIANFFLNYSSNFYNDEVFIIKKALSLKLEIDIKDIKLIGSGHTNFYLNKEKNKIITKKSEDVKDWDFAIINKKFFDEVKDEIVTKELYRKNYLRYPIIQGLDQDLLDRKNFEKNLKKGKLHLRYVDKEYKIIKICNGLKRMLNERFSIKLSISCCIYDCETNFLNNQENYYMSADKLKF